MLLERATADIDARYGSAVVVEEIVQSMAEEHNLPERWLNSNAVAFLPDDVSWIAVPPDSSAVVRPADLPSLAAMKLATERMKDIEDLGRIACALGTRDPEEFVMTAHAKYGEGSLPLAGTRESTPLWRKRPFDPYGIMPAGHPDMQERGETPGQV